MSRPQTVSPREILVRAADLFEQKGYDGVTTHEIAAAAGVSEGTLFHYFHSKQELFTVALLLRSEARELQREFAALLEGAEQEARPAAEVLDRLSRLFLPFCLKAARALALLSLRHSAVHIDAGKADPPQGLRIATDALAAYFARLERRGEATPGDAAARAVAFLSALFGYAISTVLQGEWGGGGLPSPPERFREQFVSDFVRGITVRPPAGPAETS